MMDTKKISRRNFMKTSIGAVASLYACSSPGDRAYDPKDLPTRVLGKTGVKVPIMAVGTGSRFCAVTDEDKALEILTYALDHGLYYWDTAWAYRKDDVISEERLGKILKTRRKEVFLSTKVRSRDPDQAKRQIEQSLKRLNTDYIDIFQLHRVQTLEDVDEVGKKGGVVDILYQLRQEKVARFIGFTGHNSAEAMKAASERFDFDTMLIALNHYQKNKQQFEEQAVPFAADKGMGVMVMKVIRPRETVENITPKELIQYALSLEHVNAAVVGTDSLEVLKANIELLKNFKSLPQSEMERIRLTLSPFYEHQNLEWMRPGYEDGYWA